MKKADFKKIICVIMSLVMIGGIAVTAGAAAIMPMYQRIYTAESSLEISTSGEANVHVRVSSLEDDSFRGVIELKRYVNNEWETVETWNVNEIGSFRVDRIHYVVSGYSYKLFSSINVFSTGGVYYETVDLESNAVYYG